MIHNKAQDSYLIELNTLFLNERTKYSMNMDVTDMINPTNNVFLSDLFDCAEWSKRS